MRLKVVIDITIIIVIILQVYYYKFITSILQSLEHEKYDAPLLALSFSYSRRAVAWRIKLHCTVGMRAAMV